MALGLPSVYSLESPLASQFDLLNASLQFEEHFAWLDTIGMTYHLGVDGLSLLLVLNGLLSGIAIYSTSSDTASVLLRADSAAELGCQEAFLAQDLLLFFLFYGLELIPTPADQ